MALPQGINFRATLGYVTDGPNESMENNNNASGSTVSYPRTTPQGNTVGWETAVGNIRDRNSANDRRLAGINYTNGSGWCFRIDLPSAGTYNIRGAFGDPSSINPTAWSLLDTSTVLAALCTGTNVASNSFKDANNTTWTAAQWPGSNTLRAATFSSTICRFRSDSTGANLIAHVYVESASGGSLSFSYTGVGGLVFSGTLPNTRGRSVQPSGGLAYSGVASVFRGALRAVTGGLVLSGNAAVTTSALQNRIINPIGGLLLAGVALVQRNLSRIPGGGFVISGAASIQRSTGATVVVLGQINDVIWKKLRILGGVGTRNDMLNQNTYWRARGTGMSINQVEKDALTGQGKTGALNEQEKDYWSNL